VEGRDLVLIPGMNVEWLPAPQHLAPTLGERIGVAAAITADEAKHLATLSR